MRKTKRESVYTNSFFLPNEIFSYNLSHRNFKVYAYLRKCSNKQHQCWPTRINIAKNCGISALSTVDLALKELVAEGLIEKAPVYSADGKSRKANLYTLL